MSNEPEYFHDKPSGIRALRVKSPRPEKGFNVAGHADGHVPAVPAASAPSRAAVPADGPDKGGKGGNAALPPLPPSNGAFLAAVVRDVAPGASAAVTSKAGDPEVGGWNALAAGELDRQCPPQRNNYFNCSTFVVGEDGGVQARKDRFSGFHTLVLDDVGTKVDRDRLNGVVPTWEIETSPGNSQVGFRLAEPIRDLDAVERLQGAAMDAGLCDRGAGGAARWVRLPNAINGKAKYRDAGGQPFVCRLVSWNAEVSYGVDALVAALGIHLGAPRPRANSSAASGPMLGGDGIWTPAPPENPVVSALKAKGLHKAETAPGRHEVTCPWVGEHTGALDDGTAYFEPDADYAAGGFRCQHSHGERYRLRDLLEFLDVGQDAARGKGSILVVAGEMHRVVRAAEKVLAAAGGFYQMGGAIVRVRVDPVTRDASTELLNEAQLLSALSEGTDWFRIEPGRGTDKPATRIRTDPKPSVVQALLRAGQYEFLPVLTGIARQPYFRDDGSLVALGGYDAASGMYGAFDGADFPLPEPTERAARVALMALKEVIAEFHFAGEADRSAAVAAMLTAAIRPSLPLAPAFNVTAGSPGSGKSYMAKLIASFATPGHPLNLSYPATGEEASKTVLAALIANPAVINFDDMQGQWLAFGAINRLLTSDHVTDRVLGSTRTVTAGTRCLVMGTGNNTGPVRDMTRRLVTIRLHHTSGSPALVSYAGNPVASVAADRGRYVAHAITIVAAYREAGSPPVNLPSIATYNAWTDAVRSALVWLGEIDPATSLIEQVESDADKDVLVAILKAWDAAIGDKPVPIRKLLEMALNDDDLEEALDEAPVQDRGSVNPSKLGWYLRQNMRRVVEGLELQQVANSNRRMWRVVRVDGLDGAG